MKLKNISRVGFSPPIQCWWGKPHPTLKWIPAFAGMTNRRINDQRK